MAVRRRKGEKRFTDLIVDPETSARLAKIRQRGTSPELAVRQILTRLGAHYRLNNRDLPGSPDVANRAGAWAVFVHGCFWHAHPGCKKATIPKRNREFWTEKFSSNRRRDKRAVTQLHHMGIRSEVVWECELHERSEEVARRLRAMLQGRGNLDS